MAIIDTGFVHAIWEVNSNAEDMTCYFVVVEQTEISACDSTLLMETPALT